MSDRFSALQPSTITKVTLLPFSRYSGLQCVDEVMGLIVESLDAWRSRQYDYYQRVLNGIL